MSSILTHSHLPLWAYIVIIAVGSVIILATVVTVLRCWYTRSATKRFAFTTSETPTRRVTVRRGRIVESSNYVSLTGSKFGLNEFNDDLEAADNKTRSRSPFEWWSTIKDRSHSRQSEMAQPGSFRPSFQNTPQTPDPVHLSPYRASDLPLSPSRPSSESDGPASPISFPKTPPASTQRPARNTNFSRPARRQHDIPQSPRLPHLERLEEADDEELQDAVEEVGKSAEKSRSSVSTYEISAVNSRELQVPPGPRGPRDPRSFISPPSSRSIGLPASPKSSKSDLAKSEAFRSPLPSQSSLRNQVRRSTSTISSTISESGLTYRQPDAPLRRLSSSSQQRESKSLDNTQQKSEYWTTRPDLKPVKKSNSKKGKVLRKKSLKKAEMASMVAS